MNGFSLAAAFALGLGAGASSCLALAGGLLLSSAASYNRRHPSASAAARMRPVLLFVAGRLLSYALLGGALGALGAAVRPSPTVTCILILVAAAYMLAAGLDMLGLAPAWLKAHMPRMPKGLTRLVLDAEGNEHPVMPLALGAATFFLPCGFTQSLQAYALTTGSSVAGAATLFVFALGTAPALLALGWASNGLKGKAGTLLFRFSGVVVVAMGLWNVQNGLTSLGYPLSLPRPAVAAAPSTQATPLRSSVEADPNVKLVDGTQVIRLKLAASPSYLPSDAFTVRAGTPVRLEIEGPGYGCRGILQVPKARASVALTQPLNVLSFTPQQPGAYVFSCGMGMYPGMIKAI